ncbi:hypothetical protein PVAND_012599 [Polypedilum vanderplanki]|uniref:Uncharacterized protein n=1 Tax=Polypedilum vanderplanki TaxID=319348 RepID=A0A9J6CM49_POLVA|nr:hypothetical protein PVAND_012599 [Polypedilum vanderplanki]
MKSTVLYHYYRPERRSGLCRMFNTKHCAITSAIYSLNVSILVVLLYSWQINVNTKKFQILGDVYYGVQISYYAIIGSHLSIIVLSIILYVGINSENIPLIAPWMLGILLFMSIEGICTVYANVLRDHINGHFDGLCKAEITFFIARAIFNSIAIYAVMKFYHVIRSEEENKSSTTISLCGDDDDDDENELNINFEQEDIFEGDEENREEIKHAAEDGSDENDSLLVGYDTDSVISL